MSNSQEKKRCIAIIPARGGSKRILRKNIKLFRGKPILEWSIQAALNSGVFDVIMVSTDDLEIADFARSCGASVPFLRSAQASSDYATTVDVLIEVIEQFAQDEAHFDLGCCLYPTAPFVQSRDIMEGKAELLAGSYDVVIPVARFDYPIWRSLSRLQNGRITQNFPNNESARSQDLPAAFHDAGQWYWFNIEYLRMNRKLFGPNTGSILLAQTMVQDIDTPEDWVLAEWKHERLFGAEK